MTNTASEIATVRWTTSSRNVQSGYGSAYGLFKPGTSADKAAELFMELTGLRGAHRAEIKRHYPDYVDGVRVESPWFSVYFTGTDRAIANARDILDGSPIIHEDPNADHDHANCIARARELGVPASWAHRAETYLSM
jgi:hypothetical protein